MGGRVRKKTAKRASSDGPGASGSDNRGKKKPKAPSSDRSEARGPSKSVGAPDGHNPKPLQPELIHAERADRAAAALTANNLRQTLALDGRATLRMRGDSMWPVIREGDEVVLRPVRSGEPAVGMVVAAEQDDRVVVHRVESVDGENIVCHGIAREDPDPPIARSDVLGIAIRIAGVPLGETGLRNAAGLVAQAASGARRVRRWFGKGKAE